MEVIILKKTIYILTTILVITIVIIAVIYFTNKDSELNNNLTEENLNETEKIHEEKIEDEHKENIYVDNNPIKIGLYINSSSGKKLITEYTSSWVAEEIMGMFYAIPTNEAIIKGTNFKTLWEKHWNEYTDIQNYRIGYNIKFTLNTGEVVDQIILNPDHAFLMFPKVQFYLYDDVNLIPGRRYYHVTQGEMNDKTQCTSVKIVGDKETKNIISPIELTVFTFDDQEDFDPITGKYRGNSHYTVLINRK